MSYPVYPGTTRPDDYAAPSPATTRALPVPMNMPTYSYSAPPVNPGVGCYGGYAATTPAVVSDPFAYAPFPSAVAQHPNFPIRAPEVSEESNSHTAAKNVGERATVVVRLPADAKLFAEEKLLNLTSSERSFVTPPLPAGREFHYTFRVEYLRDGEKIARSKQIGVKSGSSVVVDFAESPSLRPMLPRIDTTTGKPDPLPILNDVVPRMPAPVSAKAASLTGDRAKIVVKLPEGATLLVDGKKNDRAGTTREFDTPPLPSGREYAYMMRAELTRAGRPEFQETKVTFRAGEQVTVDFSEWPGAK